MYAVYKYRLEIPAFAGPVRVLLPKGAKILRGGLQNAEFYIWALVDIDTPHTETVEVVVLGTGHQFYEWPGEHLNSEMSADGSLVFHYFLPRKVPS